MPDFGNYQIPKQIVDNMTKLETLFSLSLSAFTFIHTPLVLNNLESIFMAMCVRCFPLGCQQWSGPPMIYSLAKSLF